MVSIIVPVFNAEKYIEKCIHSLEYQSYKDLEIIIINDGSTDLSQKICENLAVKDQRIKLHNIENGGVSKARNFGKRLAQGEYICFVDSDDYIDSNYIENYMDMAHKTKVDIIIGGVEEERDGTTVSMRNKGKLVLSQKKDIEDFVCSILDNRTDQFEQYNAQILGYCVCKLYKKDTIKDIDFPEDVPIREDAIFNIKAFLAAKKIMVTDILGYHYVINCMSATGRFRKNYTYESGEYLKKCKDLWKQNSLPINSYYIACLYAYTNWLKLYVMHLNAPFTISERLKLIKTSFLDSMWIEGFNNVNSKTINRKYKILKILFKRKTKMGIFGMYSISRIKGRN